MEATNFKQRFMNNYSALEMSLLQDEKHEGASSFEVGSNSMQLVLCIMIRGKITNRMVDIWTQELMGKHTKGSKRDVLNTNLNENFSDEKGIVVFKCYSPNADVIIIDGATLPGSGGDLKKFLSWCGSGYSSLDQVLNAREGSAVLILNEKWIIDNVNCIRSNLLKSKAKTIGASAITVDKVRIMTQSLMSDHLAGEGNTISGTDDTVSIVVWNDLYLHPLFSYNQVELSDPCTSSSSSDGCVSGNSKSIGSALIHLEEAINNDIANFSDPGSNNLISSDAKYFACANAGTVDIGGTNKNKHITDVLQPLQEMYSLKANEQYRALSYKRCIDLLKKREKVTDIVQLQGLKGIGKSLLDKIQEVLETGALQKWDNFQTDPKVTALVELSLIWGVGSNKAEELFKKGYRSIADLRRVRVGAGPNVDITTTTDATDNSNGNINNTVVEDEEASPLIGILNRQQRIGLKYYEELLVRIPRKEVTELGAVVAQHVEALCPGSEFIIGGSYRRGAVDCGDIDCIIYPPPEDSTSTSGTSGRFLNLSDLIVSLTSVGFLTDHLTLPHNYYTSETDSPRRKKQKSESESAHVSSIIDPSHASYMGVCVLQEGSNNSNSSNVSRAPPIHRRIDIKTYPRSAYACSLLYFTGNDHFNRSMRVYASKKGYSLGNDGLYRCVRDNQRNKIASQVDSVPCKTEREVFEFLGLPYKEPWERHCF